MRRFLACLLLPHALAAQQAQNPSPMVEHTREHPRIKEESPVGRRETLEMGTLFIPAAMKSADYGTLFVFFHGGTWLPEFAAAANGVAVIAVQAGTGSSSYTRLFENPGRFLGLVRQAESKAGGHFSRVLLGGWSAGCGAVRQILKTRASYDRTDGILLIDGMHTDYPDAHPGPLESKLATENLDVWLQFGRDALAGRKRMIVTHTEIFPGTFASTTETADYLLKQLGVARTAVLKWGPMATQQLSEAHAGSFLLMGFAGNSAPDHVDQLHALPEYLKMLM
jgi:hypothetical protein